ncbi:protein rogdi homolog isoform X2 [Coregonus clupeaformis]|uniref:protein rogdi homolog isoform X2 n=1 Tax=Coregonus clupeaformis TaxID=59861 RepID=UPI001BE046BF|nr:protein rogdi homolog isoform X2 [Coregonus clupeaformis]
MLNSQISLSELSKMSGPSQAERAVLEEEFNWLLKEEVHAVLKQLQDILKEASRRFSMPTPGLESQLKQENFILGSSTHHHQQQQFSNLPGFESMTSMDQVKGVLTLQGEALTQADINLKTAKSNQVMHFTFRDDKHWKFQQIQDARNHVNQALQLLSSRDESYHFKTGAEVNKLMDAVMLQLTRARNRLTTPAAMTLPELATSGLTMFTPPMPSDVMVNFYINLSKLCLTVYQLHPMQPNTTKNFRPSGSSVLHNPGAMFELNNAKFEVSQVHKVECVVPWLNNTLLFFTISLQLCQQLKDKISVFSSFWNYRPF